MEVLYNIICLITGYGFGCFSTAYFVGKAYNIDIRKEGSGNLGSTNALRTLGKKAGALTFLGDILKAAIPIIIARIIFSNMGESIDEILLKMLYIGLGVVLGHNFPFWLGFKGGKGIAVTASVILCIAHWQVIIGGFILFIVIVVVTRYVSVGSLVAALYLPVNVILFYRDSPQFVHMLIVSFIFTILAYIRHSQNIIRLFHGTERKIGEKKE